jgi:hypothetical protein
VRSWPRLPRDELALLFPSGSTRHMPASGGPITREDVRVAKSRHSDLAQQIAMFFNHRSHGGAPLAIADAGSSTGKPERPQRIAALPDRIEPAAPSLVEQPRPAAMPVSLRASLSPSVGDRERLAGLMKLAADLPHLVSGPAPARRPGKLHLASLTGASLPAPPAETHARAADQQRQVASLGPTPLPQATLTDAGRFDWAGWIAAPAYDDEHPEELSYRPFPIAPYMTESADEPVMGELVAHDVARTFEVLDQFDATASPSFSQGDQSAKLLSAQRFTGTAIKLDAMKDAEPEPAQLAFGKRTATSR